MGDRPINLNSPEQLSWVIYSRKPQTRRYGLTCLMNVCLTQSTNAQSMHTVRSYIKQKAHQCRDCYGTGRYESKRRMVHHSLEQTSVLTCDATGYILRDTATVAGLKFMHLQLKWISANGFWYRQGQSYIP